MSNNEDSEKAIIKKLSDKAKQYPLLTRDQEKVLVLQYQTPLKALIQYFKDNIPQEDKQSDKAYRDKIFKMAQHNLLTPGTRFYSWPARQAMDTLVNHNLRLILNFARKGNGNTLTTYDLFVEGSRGFMHAVDKFDLGKTNIKGEHLKLSTYATWWVKQYIQRAIQDFGRTIRIPIHIHDQINKIRRAYGEWSSTHGDENPPTPKILSELTGFDEETVSRLGRFLFDIESIDETTNQDDNLTGVDYLEAEPQKYNADAGLEASRDKIELLAAIHKFLLPKEQIFIKMKYGLANDGIDRTDNEIAHALAMKRKDVQKLEKDIIDKLKASMDAERFNCA